MNSPTLSIVIPAYNEEDCIEACLQAIKNQSVAPDEVIVVDNNSTDGTAAIVAKFPFVRFIKEKKQGLFYSRRTGMDAASSEVIARIDADTYVTPDWVAAIKAAFADKDLHAATGPVGYHDTPFPVVSLHGTDFFLRIARMGNFDFMFGANMVMRRSAWEQIRDELCNNPDIFEDVDITIHLQRIGIVSRYLLEMKALVSCRRLADNPRDYLRYMGGHSRTFRRHGIHKPAAYYAQVCYVIAYAVFKVPHMMYDPHERRFKIMRLLEKQQARPDPMTTKWLD